MWIIFANYQRGVKPDRGYGGGGYLRLMRFHPDNRHVEVRTYSPWYDNWLEDDAQHFTLELAPLSKPSQSSGHKPTTNER